MNNLQLADTFQTIANLLEIKGEIIYKTLAYRKAAESLNSLGQDINDIWRAGKLNEVPGVGKAIAEKIDELLTTGQLGFLEKLKLEVPLGLVELLKVPDVGPKKAALFWHEAGITNVAELEAAARTGKLRGLPGMGEKSEAKILAGVEALQRRGGRIPIGRAWLEAQALLAYLRALPDVGTAELAGSLRRMRSTVGDLDLVASSSSPQAVMAAFKNYSQVVQVIAGGDAKTSVELYRGLRVQLWIQPPERFGTVLQYATGSKDHNVRLRELAIDRGFSLSEQRLVRTDGSELLCSSEEEVYAAIGLPYIPPELREDRGEIEAALSGKLPALLSLSDLKAELHCHTTWSDGSDSIRAMAGAAVARGLHILAITDHSRGLGVTNGLSPEGLLQQRVEIDAVQQEMGDKLRLLQGSEVEIHADGSLEFPDEVLASLDIVVASVHTGLRQPREKVTARLLNAIRNPHVDIIGHPTGGLIGEREPADVDMDALLGAAAESGTALEINADPSRLDLNDVYARRAVELGVHLSVNRDAHSCETLGQNEFGVATARRGWVGPQHVINAWSAPKLLDWLTSRI
ncbi:MAG TPA: DNA polymerase/3'-5' exonuclease PolX [Anaerolineaceae bacterium]